MPVTHIKVPSLLFIPSTIAIPTPRHSCGKPQGSISPCTFYLLSSCLARRGHPYVSSRSQPTPHGRVGNELKHVKRSTQFGSHFVRLPSTIPVPRIPIPRLGNTHHSSLCVFLWYAPFLSSVCIYAAEIRMTIVFFCTLFWIFTFALRLGLITSCYSPRAFNPYRSVIRSTLVCVCCVCCPLAGRRRDVPSLGGRQRRSAYLAHACSRPVKSLAVQFTH